MSTSTGQRWTYQPPQHHEVAWLAVAQGKLRAPASVTAGEFVVFEESDQPIAIQAETETAFFLGSAAKHPHQLVLDQYSVHTSCEALIEGESEIQRIGKRLFADGLLR